MTLWIAYGVAIFFAALAVATGSTAMWLNGVAYDASFSTILRTSYIGEVATGRPEYLPHNDGSRPLPKQLAKAVVVVDAAQPARNPVDVIDKERSESNSNAAKTGVRVEASEAVPLVSLKHQAS